MQQERLPTWKLRLAMGGGLAADQENRWRAGRGGPWRGPGDSAFCRHRSRDPRSAARASRDLFPGPAPHGRAIPGVRAHPGQAHRVPAAERAARLPRRDRGEQAGEREGELRRRLAFGHRVPRASADGLDAARARGPACRRRHAVRQSISRVRDAFVRAAADAGRGGRREQLSQGGRDQDARGPDEGRMGARTPRRSISPSTPRCARIPKPAARRCT